MLKNKLYPSPKSKNYPVSIAVFFNLQLYVDSETNNEIWQLLSFRNGCYNHWHLVIKLLVVKTFIRFSEISFFQDKNLLKSSSVLSLSRKFKLQSELIWIFGVFATQQALSFEEKGLELRNIEKDITKASKCVFFK